MCLYIQPEGLLKCTLPVEVNISLDSDEGKLRLQVVISREHVSRLVATSLVITASCIRGQAMVRRGHRRAELTENLLSVSSKMTRTAQQLLTESGTTESLNNSNKSGDADFRHPFFRDEHVTIRLPVLHVRAGLQFRVKAILSLEILRLHFKLHFSLLRESIAMQLVHTGTKI